MTEGTPEREGARMKDCEELHAEHPTGYVAFQEWAESMGKTHKQIQCPVCGLYAVWVKREEPG